MRIWTLATACRVEVCCMAPVHICDNYVYVEKQLATVKKYCYLQTYFLVNWPYV